MRSATPLHIERRIARSRLVLSVAALVAVFADPTEPLVSQWIPLTSGRFAIDPLVLILMAAHLSYSLVLYLGLSRRWLAPEPLADVAIWADVAFGAAIACLTEGVSSPFYAFFVFAVVVAGFRDGLRRSLLVTGVSVGLYLCLILVSAPGNGNLYIMRPAYLAITGYLVGYLGQQRMELQEEVRQLEAADERHRIARELHDGFVQALAGINLRIESCRKLLSKQRDAEAFADLTELQASVNREYDDLRAYMRSLAGVDDSPAVNGSAASTHLVVTASLSGSLDLVDHVFQIAREGISNVRRHASATAAAIHVGTTDTDIHIDIRDDGVGFASAAPPWSIASRVRELGGHIEIMRPQLRGARLVITLPQT